MRHSQAAQLKIRLDMGEETIHVVVDDDGKGFDLEDLPDEVGAGLRIIRDRVEMLGEKSPWTVPQVRGHVSLSRCRRSPRYKDRSCKGELEFCPGKNVAIYYINCNAGDIVKQ